jgi:hypothetical protein
VSLRRRIRRHLSAVPFDLETLPLRGPRVTTIQDAVFVEEPVRPEQLQAMAAAMGDA